MPTNYTEVFFVRPEKLKRYRGALTDAKQQSLKIALGEMDDLGRKLVKDLQTKAPEQKGLFAQGFTYRVVKSGPQLGSLYVNWYPKDRPKNLLDWITFGTGIYGPRRTPVVPKRKKFLAWQNPNTGKWNRRKSVRGMKPNKFVFSVWAKAQDDIGNLYQRIGKLIADRILEKSNRA